MNIVVELEFPWSESGTRQDELDFAEVVLRMVGGNPLGPKGGQIASVKTVRGSQTLARRLTE